MLRLLTGGRAEKPIPYEEARDLVAAGTMTDRRLLAGRADTQPEILYYLADDPDPDVRRRIAANPGTPIQANRALADDDDDSVRCELARKIARLVPDLPEEEQSRLRDRTIEVLEVLARDHLPQVRQILAEELKHAKAVPVHIIQRLARDLDEIVAAPIVEYSPLLSDQDLLEIIATGKVSGVLQAIARRHNVGPDVSDAVVATLDIPAVASLLANPSAQIREATLDAIVERAHSIEDWHEPLVLRPELSVRAIRRIAGFVASSLVNALMETHDLDNDTAAELSRKVRTRVAKEVAPVEELTPDAAEARVRALHAEGRLDEKAVGDMIDLGQKELAFAALGLRSTLGTRVVRDIMASRTPKAVTALAWKAGLPMRTARRLQQMAGITHQNVLNARNGIHYPMNDDEMTWLLGYFTGT
ncbi:DUF2336 domain-containing protein [Zavarzinia sp. CC-PAN008]|uniref:DUF2336 domain-containing protein n=1 Tax=Zavarzinia sp. CC-PAN008 TaxID=3243332 RepID=UPI003F74AB49